MKRPLGTHRYIPVFMALFVLNVAFIEEPERLNEAEHALFIETEGSTLAACSSPFDDAGEDWLLLVDSQFAAVLKSSDDAVRSKALQDLIITVKLCGDLIRFSESIPALLNVYGFDQNESNRIMAVAALYAINDEDGMDRLRVLSQQVVQSDRVLQYTKRALYNYQKRTQ